MPNRVNNLLMQEYTDRYKNVGAVIAVGYEGLGVEKTNVLRRTLAKKNIRLKLVKNRIAKIAFRELAQADISAILTGQTALADGEDPVSVARTLVDFGKENKELKIRGAFVEATVLDEKGVIGLSKSPTKEELKGIISGQALSPGAKVSGALLGTGAMLASQIKKIADKGEGGEQAA